MAESIFGQELCAANVIEESVPKHTDAIAKDIVDGLRAKASNSGQG